MITEIKPAAERSAALTRQLLAFSRKQILHLEVVDLNAVVRGLKPLLSRLTGEDVELATRLAPPELLVRVDPGQIEQVILNLCINSRDAMPEGGRLSIETARVELDAASAEEQPELSPGSYALLAVADEGCGMDSETLSRVFEPFFTTKGPDRGTGLGLATVYGIVKQSGGHIWFESEAGRGTTCKVYLPVVTEKPGARSGPRPIRSPGGRETILLVEDEEAVRRLSRRILELQGYTVLEASRPEEAEAIAAGEAGTIHLLLTDVVMPTASGRKLADRLLASRPGMKVLFMSGYTDNAIVHHGVLDETTAFLQKPFTPQVLARRVREVLDGVGPGSGRGQRGA
jgi:CheY-like chemotaxis protein